MPCIKNIIVLLIVCCTCGCSFHQGVNLSSTTAPEKSNMKSQYPLGIIGETEQVYVENVPVLLSARIDTGATTSSIGAKNIQLFERDRKEWITFELQIPNYHETIKLSKPIIRKVSIKRSGASEVRYVVPLTIKMGNLVITEEFSLGDRQKFKHPVLIGRNILYQRAMVDVSLRDTLETKPN